MDCANHPGVDAPYSCFRCHAPICVDCETKLEGASICLACYGLIREQIAKRYDAEARGLNYPGALLAGAAAVVVTALAWSQLALWGGAGFWSGFIAALVGSGVGWAVRTGAGDKRGHALQQMAGVLALVAIILGHYLIYYRTGQAEAAGPGFTNALMTFPSYLSEKLGFLDWLFLVVGLVWAYWIPHVRSLKH